MKKRILYISRSGLLGGGGNVLLTLLKSLDREIYQPIVIIPTKGPLAESLNKIGVKTVILPLAWWISLKDHPFFRKGNMVKNIERIKQIIDLYKIDIVHTNTSVVIEGAIASKIAKKPHLWHIHEVLENHSTLEPLLPPYLTYKLIYLLSEEVVVVSNYLKESIERWIGKDTTRVIYNGIIRPDDEIDSKNISNCSIKNNQLGKSILICTIGSIVKEKGYTNLIKAAKLAVSKNPSLKFLIIGNVIDYSLMKKLREMIKDLSLERHVVFLGRIDGEEKWKILRNIDIYLTSSEVESFSLATVEAMSLGKPVISTRCGGPEEIIIHNKTGLLVPKNSPESLAEAILYLVKNPRLRHEMGCSGKKRYEELFSSQIFAKNFQTIYGNIRYKKELDREEKLLTEALIHLTLDIYNMKYQRNLVYKMKYNLPFYMRLYWNAIKCDGFVKTNLKVISKIFNWL